MPSAVATEKKAGKNSVQAEQEVAEVDDSAEIDFFDVELLQEHGVVSFFFDILPVIKINKSSLLT